MPLHSSYDYRPSFFLKNGHINTLYAYFFRRQDVPPFQRERYFTKDGDFIDLDWIKQGSKKLAILLHGLEGSTDSQYIIGMTNILQLEGYDVLAMNHRSCSGVMNNKASFYHSGFTNDFEELLGSYAPLYEDVVAIGYSLGGNVLLRYAGTNGNNIPPNLKCIVSVSAPCDLHGSSLKLLEKQNKLYAYQFLKTLKKKIMLKSKYFDSVKAEDFQKVNTLWDFDDYYTAPLHGFQDAMDYYKSCSSKGVLDNILIPTYLISALDDPFLSKSCFPYHEAEKSEFFHFIPLKYGGHVGFNFQNRVSYVDNLILNILPKYIEI